MADLVTRLLTRLVGHGIESLLGAPLYGVHGGAHTEVGQQKTDVDVIKGRKGVQMGAGHLLSCDVLVQPECPVYTTGHHPPPSLKLPLNSLRTQSGQLLWVPSGLH